MANEIYDKLVKRLKGTKGLRTTSRVTRTNQEPDSTELGQLLNSQEETTQVAMPDTRQDQNKQRIINNDASQLQPQSIDRRLDGINKSPIETTEEVIEPDGEEMLYAEDADIGQNVSMSGQKQEPEKKERTKEELARLQEQQLGKDPFQNEVPGGRAITAQKDKRNALNRLSKGEGGQTGVGSRLKNLLSKEGFDSAKVAAKQASAKLKQLAIQAGKVIAQFATKAFVFLFTNPYGWIVLALMIALAIILIMWSGFFAKNNAKVSDVGKSPTVAVDPIADKEWIQKVLMMTGNKDVTKMMSETFLNSLKNDLTNLKTQLNANPDAVTKIDAIMVKVENAKAATGDNKLKIATEIKNDLVALAETLFSVPHFPTPIKTTYPIKALANPANVVFNNHPHSGTPSNPCRDSACTPTAGWPARTYMQFAKNTCDAVDLKVGNGVEVDAAFGGKVSIKGDSVWVEYTSNTDKFVAVYAHMKENVQDGMSVNAGDKLGVTGSGHLHFELAVNDQCVVGTPSEVKTALSENNPVGKLLWAKMAAVMNLQ